MKNNISEIYDIIIVGGGPGGMTSGIYAARANAKILMMEKGAPGGKVIKTSDIENYPGFTKIPGGDLASSMFLQTQELNVPFEGKEITNLEKRNNLFVVKTSTDDVFYSKTVIVATGTEERKINVPGEDQLYGLGVSYCAVCDGIFYKDKEIIVVGGGYSALEESLYLTKFVSKIYLIHRRQGFRADEKIVNKVKQHPKIELVLDSVVTGIFGTDKVEAVEYMNLITHEKTRKKVAAIFPYIGADPITSFLKDFPVLDDNKYLIVNDKCETAVPGLYGVGDVTNTNLRQIVTAVSDGAKAAQFAIQYLDNLDGQD